MTGGERSSVAPFAGELDSSVVCAMAWNASAVNIKNNAVPLRVLFMVHLASTCFDRSIVREIPAVAQEMSAPRAGTGLASERSLLSDTQRDALMTLARLFLTAILGTVSAVALAAGE